MLCAYEVQYRAQNYLAPNHPNDNLDTSTSNIVGAAAGVISACMLCSLVNCLRFYYKKKLLAEGKTSKFGSGVFKFMECGTRIGSCLGIGRASDADKLKLKFQLKQQRRELLDPTNSRREIRLSESDENLIIETIVGNQDINVWSILMPALYQLVPGSIIAKMWFNSIFPPRPEDVEEGQATDTVFSNLMVISTSLALGLIIGFVMVQIVGSLWLRCQCRGEPTGRERRALSRLAGMYSVPVTKEDDQFAATERSVKVNEGEADADADADANANSSSYFPVSLETEGEPKELENV